jgi:hypothetical protein
LSLKKFSKICQWDRVLPIRRVGETASMTGARRRITASTAFACPNGKFSDDHKVFAMMERTPAVTILSRTQLS